MPVHMPKTPHMPTQKHTLAVVGGAVVAGAVTGIITLAVTRKAMDKVSDMAEGVLGTAADKAQDVMDINTKLLTLGAACTASIATAACINNVVTLAKVGKDVAEHVKVPPVPHL